MRGSYTILGYKRVEAEFVGASAVPSPRRVVAPRRLARGDAGRLLRPRDGHVDGRPHELRLPTAVRVGARSTFWPTRRLLMLRGGVELLAVVAASPARARFPSVETVYTPATLPGLGAEDHVPAFAGHRRGSTGAPRPAIPGAAASTASRCTTTPTGTSSSASSRSTTKRSSTFRSCAKPGSSRSAACAQTTYNKDGQQIPFFMLPSRRRRIDAARIHQLALPRPEQPARFRRSGASWSTASSTRRSSTTPARSPRAASDLDFDGLKSDYGFGVRFHGPFATPLRIEVARSHEGLALVFATSAVF